MRTRHLDELLDYASLAGWRVRWRWYRGSVGPDGAPETRCEVTAGQTGHRVARSALTLEGAAAQVLHALHEADGFKEQQAS